MKVNDQTRKVIRRELFWLPDLLTKFIHEIKYELLDLDTLSLGVSADLMFDVGIEKIILIAQNGRVIGEVGRGVVPKDYLFKRFRQLLRMPISRNVPRTFPETVEGALNRLWTEYGDVHYVLRFSGGGLATLYKVPKHSTIIDHLNLKSDEAGREFARFLREA